MAEFCDIDRDKYPLHILFGSDNLNAFGLDINF